MATILNVAFDSDEEDEDFVPVENEVEYDDNGKVIKRKSSKLGGNLLQRDTRKIVKKPKLRVGAAVVSDEETEIENLSSNVVVSVPVATPAPKVAVNQELSQITPVQVSDKISSLWDQLKSGSANPTPSPPPNVEISTPSVKISGKPKLDFSRKTGTVASVTPVAVTTVKFAGENLQVPTDAPKPVKIGIDAALEELATKKSISTLTKSKLDWENDKTVQGDAFELAQHRKDGFLGKSEFLARVEEKKFERERAGRLAQYEKSVTLTNL